MKSQNRQIYEGLFLESKKFHSTAYHENSVDRRDRLFYLCTEDLKISMKVINSMNAPRGAGIIEDNVRGKILWEMHKDASGWW